MIDGLSLVEPSAQSGEMTYESQLTIDKVNREMDQKDIHCLAFTDMGYKHGVYKMELKDAAEPALPTEEPKIIRLRLGEELEMKCEPSPDQVVKQAGAGYKWSWSKLDGTTGAINLTFKNQKAQTFKQSNVDQSDSGTYRCTASNNALIETSQDFRIQVFRTEAERDSPEIVYPETNTINALIGQRLALPCIAKSVLPAGEQLVIDWLVAVEGLAVSGASVENGTLKLKEGYFKRVRNYLDISIDSLGNFRSVLFINKVSQRSADYYCLANGTLGYYSLKKITVKASIQNEPFYYTDEPIIELRHPPNVSISLGQSREFICTVYQNTIGPQLFKWLHRIPPEKLASEEYPQHKYFKYGGKAYVVWPANMTGKPAPTSSSDSRMDLVQNARRQMGLFTNRLTITSANKDHDGEYVCVASTRKGWILRELQLTVDTSTEQPPPRHGDQPKNQDQSNERGASPTSTTESDMSLRLILIVAVPSVFTILIIAIVIYVWQKRNPRQQKSNNRPLLPHTAAGLMASTGGGLRRPYDMEMAAAGAGGSGGGGGADGSFGGAGGSNGPPAAHSPLLTNSELTAAAAYQQSYLNGATAGQYPQYPSGPPGPGGTSMSHLHPHYQHLLYLQPGSSDLQQQQQQPHRRGEGGGISAVGSRSGGSGSGSQFQPQYQHQLHHQQPGGEADHHHGAVAPAGPNVYYKVNGYHPTHYQLSNGFNVGKFDNCNQPPQQQGAAQPSQPAPISDPSTHSSSTGAAAKSAALQQQQQSKPRQYHPQQSQPPYPSPSNGGVFGHADMKLSPDGTSSFSGANYA